MSKRINYTKLRELEVISKSPRFTDGGTVDSMMSFQFMLDMLRETIYAENRGGIETNDTLMNTLKHLELIVEEDEEETPIVPPHNFAG